MRRAGGMGETYLPWTFPVKADRDRTKPSPGHCADGRVHEGAFDGRARAARACGCEPVYGYGE